MSEEDMEIDVEEPHLQLVVGVNDYEEVKIVEKVTIELDTPRGKRWRMEFADGSVVYVRPSAGEEILSDLFD